MKNIFTDEREIKTTKLYHALITFLVLVVVMLMIVTIAEFIFGAVTAPFDGMYQMVLFEECEGTKHIRLIDSRDFTFQFCQ